MNNYLSYTADISLIGLGIIAALVFAVVHLVTRFRYAINVIFSLFLFLFIFLGAARILRILFLTIFPDLLLAKIELSLILLLAVTFLVMLLVYPSQKFRLNIFYLVGILVPGITISGVILFTDLIITGASIQGDRALEKGQFFLIYLIAVVLYLSISFFAIIFRLAIMRSRILKHEILNLLYGMLAIILLILATAFILPEFFDLTQLVVPGAAASAIGLMLLLHHAIYDIFNVDFSGFYTRLLFRLIIFSLLFAPVFLLLRYESTVTQLQTIPAIGLSIIFFMYLFFIFTYLRPRIQPIFERKYRNLMFTVNELFNELSQVSVTSDRDDFWNNFILIVINGLKEKLDIQRIYFFLYGSQTGRYLSYYSAGKSVVDEISPDSAIVQYFNEYHEILEKNVLYISEMEMEFTGELLDFLDSWKLDTALPFYDHEEKLIGILFISDIPPRYYYSQSFYSVLELYRIQLQTYLANEMMIENVKTSQIIEHDQMVVKTIKSKITPSKLHQIHNFRVSSMYINNSTLGGDYFDTVGIGRNRVGLFITDSSYSGVDSGLLSLELYTVLHTPQRGIESPDKLLALMNWVISTSRIARKNAPSSFLIYSPNGTIQYSNAGYNPLTMFNSVDSTFTSYDTQGQPIGVDKNTSYSSRTIRAGQGSIGYIYSEGLVSATDGEGKTYNPERIKDIILMNRDQTPASLIRIVYSDFNNFAGEQKQERDITLLLFRT